MGSNQLDKVHAQGSHFGRSQEQLRSVIDDVAQQVSCGLGISGFVETRHGLFDAVGEGHLAVGIAEGEKKGFEA